MVDISRISEEQRSFFNSGATCSVAFRKQMLTRMLEYMVLHEADISAAIHTDLNKSEVETYLTETSFVISEIRLHLKKLKKWASYKRVGSPLVILPSSSYIVAEPLGSVLIIAPWNYPLQLILCPLVGAISAGNCVTLKPAEYSGATSRFIAEMVAEIFDPRFVSCYLGSRDTISALLDQRFDYIFFTGSQALGRHVMESAAKFLTPVTLELGGKSPCVVDATANISMAARRIVWGKFLNAGQTCVAPDYVYVDRAVYEPLKAALILEIERQYGPNPLENTSYPHIINRQAFERLSSLISAEANILYGGKLSPDNLCISPCLLGHPAAGSRLLTEEIFGPLLPLLVYDNISEVVSFVRSGDKPLAFYHFSSSRANISYLMENIQAGGGCLNDVVVHLANPRLPFGGVGGSGIGKYHGYFSFTTFSHLRSFVKSYCAVDVRVRYQPYKVSLSFLRRFL